MGGLGRDGVVYLGLVGDISQGNRLLRADPADTGACKFHLILAALHHLGGDGADALFQHIAGFHDRLAGDVGGGGGIGAGIVG